MSLQSHSVTRPVETPHYGLRNLPIDVPSTLDMDVASALPPYPSKNVSIRLSLRGSLTYVETKSLKSFFQDLVKRRFAFVQLDIAKVEFMDGSGLGALVQLQDLMSEYGGLLKIVGVQGQPLRLLRFLGVERCFHL